MKTYSVITICLDCETTIRKTIDSIMIQQSLPKQYIFVVGHSNDDSYNIILSYKEFIKNKGVEFLLILQKKNKKECGIPSAWNMGIDKVSGDIVAILNADDYYPSEFLMTKVINRFSADNNIFALSGVTRYYNNTTKIYKNRSKRLFPILNPINHPATFISIEVYKKIGTYDTKYSVSSDYDFLYRMHINKYNHIIDNTIVVERKPNGFADNNKLLARNEAFKIASKYFHNKVLLYFALFVRVIFNR
jgi:glycosyltransferase involved in cell wall biosynthesis